MLQKMSRSEQTIIVEAKIDQGSNEIEDCDVILNPYVIAVVNSQDMKYFDKIKIELKNIDTQVMLDSRPANDLPDSLK